MNGKCVKRIQYAASCFGGDVKVLKAEYKKKPYHLRKKPFGVRSHSWHLRNKHKPFSQIWLATFGEKAHVTTPLTSVQFSGAAGGGNKLQLAEYGQYLIELPDAERERYINGEWTNVDAPNE